MGLADKLKSFFSSGKKQPLDVSKRFELQRGSVSGTMSKFYKARDRETDAIVGLKILDKEKTEAFESRFRQLQKPSEGEIASTLKHHRIVDTFDFGLTVKDEPYLLMEFLDGVGLQQLILTKDPSLEGNRLKLIDQMAQALFHVHKQGFIHRDICPRNFICLSDATELKLIDFGLTLPAQPAFLQPGNRTGTPLYMAPEIIRRRKTDFRVDLFAFGVMVFQLCTFDFPWPVGDASGTAALAHDAMPPTDICTLRPNIDKKIARTIMQCLASNPLDRPASMEVVLRAIRAAPKDTAF